MPVCQIFLQLITSVTQHIVPVAADLMIDERVERMEDNGVGFVLFVQAIFIAIQFVRVRRDRIAQVAARFQLDHEQIPHL